MNNSNYPFAQQLITDTTGKICQVVLNVEDYQNLLEAIEDSALYQAMKNTQDEVSLSKEEALRLLEEE